MEHKNFRGNDLGNEDLFPPNKSPNDLLVSEKNCRVYMIKELNTLKSDSEIRKRPKRINWAVV